MQLNKALQPDECTSKEEIRQQIDRIDKQLVELFAQRFAYVKEIVKYKEQNVDAIVALERKNFVIEERSQWAEEHGLDKTFYAQLFTLLIEHNISQELEIIKNKS
jgi:isochorismate pyruvate lyase